MDPNGKALAETALEMGVSDARIIRAADIPIDPAFAGYCKTCPNFGKSLSCPPVTMGPDAFRTYAARFGHALAFKFDIPWDILLTPERASANRVLHETAAALEQAAKTLGYSNARGFAAGACKMSFCPDEANCAALSKDGRCRHPDHARQSLSGMGVNFKALSERLGWQMETKIPTDPAPGSTGMLAGIVLFR